MTEGKRISVRFYATPAGNEPVREWLWSLDKADTLIIGKDIATVQDGWPIGMPTCRPMGSGLFEVRSDVSDKRIARVLFCFDDGEIVLLHGFIKKAQKPPPADLALAIKRKGELK